MVIVIILIIFLLWLFFNKKNNLIMSNKSTHRDTKEYIDTSTLFDGCGKDITYSNKLLNQLYGASDPSVVMYDKNDDLLYSKRWTSINVCRNLTQRDIDIYGNNEAI